MEAFPFTDAEWDPLKPVADAVMDAGRAGDEVLKASLQLDMLERIDGLRERHGDHPVLLETAADYTEDAAEAVALYRRAAEIAAANGLPTLSIRTSCAQTLVLSDDPAVALDELHACGGEAAAAGKQERDEWVRLLLERSSGRSGGDSLGS